MSKVKQISSVNIQKCLLLVLLISEIRKVDASTALLEARAKDVEEDLEDQENLVLNIQFHLSQKKN